MKTAIYARQSIEKQDSVSLEAQIEKCRLLAQLNNWDCVEYKDAGYSGSNINRPDFERLLADIKKGHINKVIAYRLDRISRSISDFANLLLLFQNHNVQFMSATENFDTSSPIGRAMVYIVMVFAQLERETITERITDNYFFRAKQGLFTGGNCPFGYKSTKVNINGKKASVLEIDPKTSPIVKRIFEQFNNGVSMQTIAISMNDEGIPTPKGSTWAPNKVKRILSNVAYATNTLEIYEYFSLKGYQIANTPEEFDGQHGLGLYGKEKGRKNRIKTEPSQQILAIGEFPPLISSEEWLRVQHKLATISKKPARLGTSETTWISGMLSCSICGYSMNLKFTRKGNRTYKYIHCRGRSHRGSSVCTNETYYNCEAMEQEIEKMIFEKINSSSFINNVPELEFEQNTELTVKKNTLLAKIYTIDNEIKNYLNNIGKGNSVIDSYISSRITELDTEKKAMLKEIDNIDMQLYNNGKNALTIEYIRDIANKINSTFKNTDVQTKNMLASALIKKIAVDDSGNIQIEWLI